MCQQKMKIWSYGDEHYETSGKDIPRTNIIDTVVLGFLTLLACTIESNYFSVLTFTYCEDDLKNDVHPNWLSLRNQNCRNDLNRYIDSF